MSGPSYEEERLWHEQIACAIIFVSFPQFLTLYFLIPAPWGKTLSLERKPWWLGPLLPARWSWFVFESPNLIWAVVCWYQRGPQTLPIANIILLSLFVLHYIRRAIVYPLTMSSNTKAMPALVVLAALCYCTFNGYLQTRALCYFESDSADYWYSPQFVLGLALFGYGARLNWHTDRYLSRLRQRSKGYQIPVGGWFDWISAPHYFGEILQWTGFWIACGNRNKAAASFAIYTASNLIPRGVAHHVWYRQHFGDKYPSSRRAVIPFLW